MPLLERHFHVAQLVSDIPFKISVIVSSSNTGLIGVISGKKGGGADSAHVEMI